MRKLAGMPAGRCKRQMPRASWAWNGSPESRAMPTNPGLADAIVVQSAFDRGLKWCLARSPSVDSVPGALAQAVRACRQDATAARSSSRTAARNACQSATAAAR